METARRTCVCRSGKSVRGLGSLSSVKPFPRLLGSGPPFSLITLSWQSQAEMANLRLGYSAKVIGHCVSFAIQSRAALGILVASKDKLCSQRHLQPLPVFCPQTCQVYSLCVVCSFGQGLIKTLQLFLEGYLGITWLRLPRAGCWLAWSSNSSPSVQDNMHRQGEAVGEMERALH